MWCRDKRLEWLAQGLERFEQSLSLAVVSALALAALFCAVPVARGQAPEGRLVAAEQSVEQVEQTLRCIEAVEADLRSFASETRSTVETARGGSGAGRQEALSRLRLLGDRRRALMLRLESCSEVAPEDQAEAQVLEERVRLSPSIIVERAVRVGGAGQLNAAPIRNAMRTRSAHLDRCYAIASRRDALGDVTATLTFSIDIRGRSDDVEVTGEGLPERFRRCLEIAGRRIRAPGGASGDDVRVAYTMTF